MPNVTRNKTAADRKAMAAASTASTAASAAYDDKVAFSGDPPAPGEGPTGQAPTLQAATVAAAIPVLPPGNYPLFKTPEQISAELARYRLALEKAAAERLSLRNRVTNLERENSRHTVELWGEDVPLRIQGEDVAKVAVDIIRTKWGIEVPRTELSDYYRQPDEPRKLNLIFTRVYPGSVHYRLCRRFKNWNGATGAQKAIKVNAEMSLTRVDKAIRRKLLFLFHHDKNKGVPEEQRRVQRVNAMLNGVVRYKGVSGYKKVCSVFEVERMFTSDDWEAWQARDWRKSAGNSNNKASEDMEL